MIKTNIKMRVTPEQSKKVQEICFKNGIFWHKSTKKYVVDTRGKFLYIEDTIMHDIPCENDIDDTREMEDFFKKNDLLEINPDFFIRTNGTCIEKKSCKIENEDLKMPNEFKVRVNSEESEKIQKVLFQDGFSWNGHKEVRHLDCKYIYSSNRRLFLLDDEHYFNKCTYRELTVEEILSYYPEKQEFTYPMYFKSKRSGNIVEFTGLTTGKAIYLNQSFVDPFYPLLGVITSGWTPHTDRNNWEQVEKPNEHLDRLDNIVDEAIKEVSKEDSHNAHYKKQKIDTIKRSKANMSLQEQKAICIFQIDRYTHREKGQNLSDIKKTRDYLDWLEEIEIKLNDKE